MSDYEQRPKHYLQSPDGNQQQQPTYAESIGIAFKKSQEILNELREAPATPSPEIKGLKYDQGKEPLSLLSRTWLLGVGRVLAFGAKKYASHNWRGGIERSRLLSAALRHIFAYMEGEDLDPETGLSHLDHASCCLMFARELHETRPDLDDRFKQKSKGE